MKNMPILFLLALMSLIVGCQESSKKSRSSSSQSAYCVQNPYAQGCYGAVNAGTTGGQQQACFQSTTNYWSMPGCPGFCQNAPTHPNCAGTTTGTTGFTAGGVTGGTSNPFPNNPSNPIYANWGVHYPPSGLPPQGNCSAAFSPSGINYTPYETRKATMSIQGKTFYNPSSSIASEYLNTSSLLRSVNGATQLFSTDAILKVRFKVLPQPENSATSPYCYIPAYKKMSKIPGYTKLQYNVELWGRTSESSPFVRETLGSFNTTVNNCTPAIDLSSYTSTYPGGIYLVVQGVRSNQGPTDINYTQLGFGGSNSFTDVRSMDCWALDVEVAADGTKSFD
jgi:hypothetical protein